VGVGAGAAHTIQACSSQLNPRRCCRPVRLCVYLYVSLSASSSSIVLQLSRARDQQDLHRLVRMGMWTKLRPGVRDFLRRAAQHFELWIYTAGSKPYADVSDRWRYTLLLWWTDVSSACSHSHTHALKPASA
jgi:hypothetical protein